MVDVVEITTPTTVITSVTESVVVNSQPLSQTVVLQPVVGGNGTSGTDGREVELQNSGTHIQWRYVGDVTWNDLVAIASLEGADGAPGTNGEEISLQKTATHIQWRLGAGVWTDLVALADLKGDTGEAGAPGTTDYNALLNVPTTFAPSTHNHLISEVTSLQATLDSKQESGDYATNTELTTGLAGKAATIHDHTASQITDFDTAVDSRIQNIIGTAPAALDTLGEIADALADDANFASTMTTALAGKAEITHTHTIANVTGLQTALDGKQAAGSYATISELSTTSTADRSRANHTGTQSADTIVDGTTNHVFTAADDTKLAGIATGATANSTNATLLARVNHTGSQAISTITGLQTALDAKQASGDYATNTALTNGLAGKSDTTHIHTIANVTGLQAALDGKQVSGSYASAVHTHGAGDLTSGTLDEARIPSLAQSKITGLSTSLAGKANTSHTHGIADLPAVMVPVLYNGTSWPARPTARTDVVVMWLDFTGTAAAPSGGITGLDVVVKGTV